MQRPDIKLVDPNNLRQIDQTIWGLSDMQKAVAKKDPESPLLPEIRKRLRETALIYNGKFGTELAAKQLVKYGFLDNSQEFQNVLSGDFAKIPTDENLRIDGIYVIGIVGLIQAGKTLVGGLMTERYPTRHYPFVGGLFAFAYAVGLDPVQMSRGDLVREVNDVIKPYLGYDRFARTVLHQARRQHEVEPVAAITCDGFRSVPEAELVLSQERGMLVAVEAAIEERYARSRMNDKKRGQRLRGFQAFKRQSDWEKENMMEPVLALVEDPPFDNTADDDGESLRKQIAERFDRILPTRPWIHKS